MLLTYVQLKSQLLLIAVQCSNQEVRYKQDPKAACAGPSKTTVPSPNVKMLSFVSSERVFFFVVVCVCVFLLSCFASYMSLVVEPTCQCSRHKGRGFRLWARKIPGGGHGNPLQYSCLENPMDGGAWRATVRKVAKSRTRLKRLSAHTQFSQLSGEQSPTVVSLCSVVLKLLQLKSYKY